MRNENRKRDVARGFGMALREARVERGISQNLLSLRLADALAVELAPPRHRKSQTIASDLTR
jgi:ribosome-binding protein aMBF1 (putative translation factor)